MIKGQTHILCMDCLGPKQTEVPIPDAECDRGSSDSSKNNMCNAHKTKTGGTSTLVVVNMADLQQKAS